ncbi:MAG TPA: FtsQ-type POTRA domain-containing protein [Microthrixaceae bacterium]|nr:FtsQ-type POTRA domain-containing protein [Microthrixaceae bacterium]
MTGTLVDPPLFDAAELDGEVEPRFRIRRVEVRKAERRRRHRLVIMVLAVMLLVGGAVLALYSPLLDVDHLDIEGLRHLDASTVGAASGIAEGQQMVDLNTEAAIDAISALPWVQRVTVTRRWPDTVEMRVVERRPIARVTVRPADPDPAAPPAVEATASTAPPVLVVTTDATVAGGETPLDALLPLVVVDATTAVTVGQRLPEAVARGIQMVGALPASIASRMVGAAIDADGAVEVQMADEARLMLGTGDDVEAKFVAAESILGGSVVLNSIERIDVRVPSAPVIARRAGSR